MVYQIKVKGEVVAVADSGGEALRLQAQLGGEIVECDSLHPPKVRFNLGEALDTWRQLIKTAEMGELTVPHEVAMTGIRK